jgi:hypothetical protein
MQTRMLRPPSEVGGSFVRENTVKSIWKKGGAAGMALARMPWNEPGVTKY